MLGGENENEHFLNISAFQFLTLRGMKNRMENITAKLSLESFGAFAVPIQHICFYGGEFIHFCGGSIEVVAISYASPSLGVNNVLLRSDTTAASGL